MIESFARVRVKFPTPSACGEPLSIAEEYAEELAARLLARLDDRVRFLGGRSDVPQLMQALDVLSSILTRSLSLPSRCLAIGFRGRTAVGGTPR